MQHTLTKEDIEKELELSESCDIVIKKYIYVIAHDIEKFILNRIPDHEKKREKSILEAMVRENQNKMRKELLKLL